MDAVLTVRGTLVLGVIVVALFATFNFLRPKPLPGIPYNRDAAAKLFGDVPEMMGYVMRTKRIFCWLTSLTTRHQSPIVQAFIKPGGLPWVIVTDPFESQDILLRRGKEFDRSEFFEELIGGILPEQHIQFISTDARFKNSRNLINHLMAPTFISEISAPDVYKSVNTLLKLWHLKSKLANGHPFSAHHDITFEALDSIFASSFGLEESESNTIQRIQALERWKPRIPDHVDEPVGFPEGSVPEIFSAILTLSNSFPYMRKAEAVKDQYIRNNVDEYVQLISEGDTKPKSALHSVLLRERDVAAKEGREPEYRKRAIADEFFGFMMAGHDTTATAMAWGIKLMTDHPAAQARLRDELRAALPLAAREQRRPTYAEITKAPVPYLDAVVDEVLRHANTIAFVVRQAQQDSTVLGRHIPRGTNVFLMANGPGYLEPNMPVQDDMRSPGARRTMTKSSLTGAWDDESISAFRPERWLQREPDTGAEVYNSQAGPSLAFGLGLRGCFGKRLALQALRIHFGLIFWEFELLSTPGALGGYEAVQRFAREPTQCYVRLKAVSL
ncbi:hypothetical protein PFICI_08932 [Pestalotiopsis fici W106-1]|uniref:Cytochrome P450 n=1 Tax=Pestalotiopsis fici (strain W106-1 / CGMCC3.15140) TaxID=1229662 RepID=W3WZ70_PESFW|nr:uncharacterized protein PFICI_08932 [Pestalotiopsis fici W106-1]ETS79079.1 hypothetical protein PFICI_08932 [Pestalotiopsis fici W106-1]